LKDELVTVEIMDFDTVGIISLKNPKALIGSQTIVEDLPFPHKNPQMNSCTSDIFLRNHSELHPDLSLAGVAALVPECT